MIKTALYLESIWCGNIVEIMDIQLASMLIKRYKLTHADPSLYYGIEQSRGTDYTIYIGGWWDPGLHMHYGGFQLRC